MVTPPHAMAPGTTDDDYYLGRVGTPGHTDEVPGGLERSDSEGQP
jgi:hypothetical protein